MVHASGISVLYEPSEPEVDIVFVHGFTGHPRSTWTLETSKVQKKRPRHQRTGSGCEPTEAPSKFLRFASFPFSRARTSLSQTSSKLGKSATRGSEATGALSVAHSSTTDQEKSSDVYWPQDLLPSKAPKARVLTYGYDTKIKIKFVQQVSQNTVDNHAWELLCSLEAMRRTSQEQNRPLVLIAHSLGGLVVKKMLKQAQDRATTHPHLNRVFLSTVSILFFGTPHRGADPRGFLHHVLSVSAQGLGVKVNKRVVATLMPDGEPVSTIGDFAALASQRNWIIYSFQEEYGVAAFGNRKVVDDHSSCLALPTIETIQHISDNHMDMCRFFGLDDPGYQKVSAALGRILAHTTSKPSPIETPDGVPISEDNPLPGPSATPISNDGNAAKTATECENAWGTLERENSTRDALKREHSTGNTLSQETMDTLMNLLRFDQIDARLLTLRTAQGKTCEWFLSKPEYLQWQNNNEAEEISSFLWIKGKPGAGKSILMKYLLSEADRASRRSGVQRRIVISFFFNARGEKLEQSTLGCYRSLLLQLFEKDPKLKAAMNDLGISVARYIENHGWNLEALTQMLTKAFSLLRDEQTLQCFVDALDECEEWEVRNMVSFFEGLGEKMPTSRGRLNICFSSRHYPSIIPKKGLQVTLEAEADHFQDISRFVEAELRLGDSDQTEEIKAAIMAKCSNIFLWAALVVPILNREYARGRMTAIRTRLDSIPPGLDELFDMILTRDDEDLDELQMCIKWILFATRPMKPHELFVAIKVGLALSSGASEDANTEYPKDFATADLCRYIESSSKGLAEVTRSTEPTVQFIHESVRDFLLSKGRNNNTHWSGFGLEVLGETQDLLTGCCLLQVGCVASHLENIPPSNPFRLENAKYPFLEYAVNNILHHSNSAEREGISQLDFLQSFPLLLWVRLFNSLTTTEIRRYPLDTHLVYILTTYNFHCLIRTHPDSPRHLEIRGGRYMYPLIAAIVLRNVEAIEALLAASGMVSASGKRFTKASLNLDSLVPTINSFDFTPWNMDLLSCLVHFDQLQMVQHYLKKTSDSGHIYDTSGSERMSGIIDAESFRLNRALFSVRSPSMTAFLIGFGADLGTMDSYASTPLCHAIKAGHVEVSKLLLSPESSLNFPLPPGFSRDLIISTIKSRVKVHSKDHFGWTALHHAANGGFSEIAEHLTSFPEVDPNEVNNLGETALHLAIQKGKWEAASRLLFLGNLNPDIPNARGETPLMIAAAGDDDYPINLLIPRCQPTDQNCKALAMFLTNSSSLISDENASHLLLFGRSHHLVNIQDRNGMTPLSTLLRDSPAGQHWIYRRIGVYLGFGANPNLRDALGRSAISYAAALSHAWPLSHLLIHEGGRADLSPDNSGRTPFTYAVLKRRSSLLEALISHSLTFVDTPDSQGRTPLWYALSGAYRASLADIPKTLEYLSMGEKLFATGKVNIFIQALPDRTAPDDLLSRVTLRLTEQNETEALCVSNRLQSKFKRYGRQEVVPFQYNIRDWSTIAELEA